jgi:cytidine deaminase
MNLLPITDEDIELIEAARCLIKRLYKQRKHHIAAALRTAHGEIYTAVHLEAHVGRVAVCAEAAVLCKAVSEGETKLDTIVAVRHPMHNEPDQEIKVVSPCGMCRELLSDYAANLKVIFNENGKPKKAFLHELLPSKYDH